MSNKLFGTDGIRGIANEKLTAQLAFNMGQAFAVSLNKDAKYKKIIIGRDTRVSGQMLSCAFVAGLNSMGFSAILPNVLPTPALSYLTKTLEVDGGVMITASHNPAEHNGLKFYDCNGCKLSLQKQAELEEIYFNIDSYLGCSPMEVGGMEFNDDLLKLWVDHIVSVLELKSLKGLKIALDTANGASYAVAPYIFKMLGAQVICYNNNCDGININRDCGSTHMEQFVAECVANDVDFGFSFDGDADRMMTVAKGGKILDGTDLMYIFAKYLKDKNKLIDDTLVTTIVTNCGLEHSLEKLGIKTIRTQVGGIHIQTEMLKNGYNLGGEENGHIMVGDVNSESCGITSSLFLLKIILDTNLTIQDLLKDLQRSLIASSNVYVSERQKQEVAKGALNDLVNELEAELGNSGRIVLRPSGTECLIRTLVEGDNQEQLDKINSVLENAVKNI